MGLISLASISNYKATENLDVLPIGDDCKKFRYKVKTIINNSNYGAKVKAFKLGLFS
jgi:hypothetical protein